MATTDEGPATGGDPTSDAPPGSVERDNGELELARGQEASRQRRRADELEEHRRPASSPTDQEAARPVPEPNAGDQG